MRGGNEDDRDPGESSDTRDRCAPPVSTGAQIIDAELHAASVELLEERLAELALERTSTRSAAVFLWDRKSGGLSMACHIVEGVVVTRPGTVLRRRAAGRPNGIAFVVFDQGAPYLCNDTASDPNYTPYFQAVASMAAVPILYQGKPFGVLSIASPSPDAFGAAHVHALQELASAAAMFLRRAQLHREKNDGPARRPFLIKGLSPQWKEVERQLERVAPTDAPVLVLGESGTGKELVANAIHFNSRRSEGPFVAVNCAAIPEPLLESTLFGHVKGAFTGAIGHKRGDFSRADGGTLFLDEVGELPIALQAKVLRAIEVGEVSPVGSDRAPERVSVRIVCATNRDLPSLVREQRFRADLYHRISLVMLELPPLRAYKDNLPILATVALRQAAERHGKAVSRITPDALEALLAHDYPGNVRELKNAVERAVILAEGDAVELSDLPRSIAEHVPTASSPTHRSVPLRVQREQWLAPLERQYLTDLLAGCRGNVRQAAREAEVDPVTFYRLLRRRGIRIERVPRGSGPARRA
jgi:transcriptional regulator with GAF, ATPase, and Fis domain